MVAHGRSCNDIYSGAATRYSSSEESLARFPLNILAVSPRGSTKKVVEAEAKFPVDRDTFLLFGSRGSFVDLGGAVREITIPWEFWWKRRRMVNVVGTGATRTRGLKARGRQLRASRRSN